MFELGVQRDYGKESAGISQFPPPPPGLGAPLSVLGYRYRNQSAVEAIGDVEQRSKYRTRCPVFRARLILVDLIEREMQESSLEVVERFLHSRVKYLLRSQHCLCPFLILD